MRCGRAIAGAAMLAAAVPIAPPAVSAAEQAIGLVVTDAGGAFVPDIRREEVEVVENGEVREVLRFEKDERPLEVVLVLDTSDSASRFYRVHAYRDVPAFVASLPPKTTCTLWTTADRPRRVGELDREAAAVEQTLGQGFGLGGTTTLLDALVDAARDLGKARDRRLALVAVSSWSSGHTAWSPPQILEKVRAPRARVLAVQYRQGGGPAALVRDAGNLTLVGGSDHERILSSLARATGGRFEAVPSALAVDEALRSFARDLAGQYRLRYLSVPAREGRLVEVRLARQGLRWRVTVDSP